MHNYDKYQNYYINYLGVNRNYIKYDSPSIISCLERDKPINTWHYQHLIFTKTEGRRIFSICPSYFKDFMEFIKPFIYVPEYQLVDKLTEFFKDKLNEYSIRIMYRMTIDKLPIEFITNSKVLKLTKEILMNHLHDESELVKEEIWNRKKDEIEQGRQYVILSKNKIVSYCKISDICYGGGNIVVYTNENYRNLGYGKQVLQATINWCIANNILPVYWVWDKNLASIALAKSLGFQIKSEEIVVATIGKTNEDRRTS